MVDKTIHYSVTSLNALFRNSLMYRRFILVSNYLPFKCIAIKLRSGSGKEVCEVAAS